MRTLPSAITRRPSLAAPLVVQTAVLLAVAGFPLVAAVVAAGGVAWLAVLLALADERAHQAQAERDTAQARVGELEAELAEAYTDPVTGLAVRRLAERHLCDAAGVVTVALVDVDDMHAINNDHDHQFGDDYLTAVANRLRQAAVDGDLVARLGGDEFVLITTRTPPALAQTLTAATANPIVIGETQIPVRLSIGICRTAGGDPHLGLGRADLAMFAAKRRRTGIEHYDPIRDGAVGPRGIRPADRIRDRHTTTANSTA